MFEWLSSIKVPSRFSSNIKGIINVPEKKFLKLKSYDCHVLMTQLLPVALRGILPPHVRLATVKLCAFLNVISQNAINILELAALYNDVVQCLDATDPNGNRQTCYGRIEETWKLDCAPNFKVPMGEGYRRRGDS